MKALVDKAKIELDEELAQIENLKNENRSIEDQINKLKLDEDNYCSEDNGNDATNLKM